MNRIFTTIFMGFCALMIGEIKAQGCMATISGTTTICSGASTTLTASGGTSYLWSTSATTAAITVSPTATNTTYTVTVTDTNGCTATSTQTVIVQNPVVARFTTVINGLTAVFTNTSTNATTYSWAFGNGQTSTQQNPSVTYATVGTYTVTLTAGGCGSTNSTTYVINYNSAPCNATPINLPQSSCTDPVTFVAPLNTASASGYTTSSCSGYNNPEDLWYSFTPAAGITAIKFDMTWANCTGFLCSNNPGFAFYEVGATCNILTELDCDGNDAGSFGAWQYQVTYTGLSPGVTYLLRLWENDNQNSNVTVIASIPALNDACENALTLEGNGCNYGATDADEPDDWSPNALGFDCLGDIWGSNENGVWCTFAVTPSTLQPISLSIQNVSCSGGNANLQMGIWQATNACGDTSSTNGTLNASNFIACSVGVGSVTIGPTNLAVGNYYLYIDGNAGALCNWNFVSEQLLPIASNSSPVCTGEIVTLSSGIGLGSPPYTYSWAGPNSYSVINSTNSTQTLIATSSSAGIYTVTVTSVQGATSTGTTTVVLNSVIATISGATTVCSGTNTTLTASGGSTYAWSGGGTTATKTVTPTATTTYTVTVTGSNGCTATQTKTVTVNALPAASLTSGGSLSCSTTSSANLTANPSSGMTYNWSVGAAVVGGTNLAVVQAAGSYTVTVTNPTTTCAKTASVTVANTTPAPTGLTSASITSYSALVSWGAVSGATSYRVEYKTTAATTWTTVNAVITGTSYTLNALNANTAYQFRVKTVCAVGTSVASTTGSFTTLTTTAYCTSQGSSTAGSHYIETVALGSYTKTSGNNNGYGNFTTTVWNVAKGVQYGLSITPPSLRDNNQITYRVWIDYNNDKDFGEANELVVAAVKIGRTPLLTNLIIPTTAIIGQVRMRVQLQAGSALAAPCASFTTGETEDYTLNIGTSPIAREVDSSKSTGISLYPNPTQNEVSLQSEVLIKGVTVLDITGKTILSIRSLNDYQTTISLQHQPAGVYILAIETAEGEVSHHKVIKQ